MSVKGENMSTANNMQVGGDHYRVAADGLQHWDLIDRYNVGYLEGCATKYLSRFRRKNGKQDLEKALHYVTKLIEQRCSVRHYEERTPEVPTGLIQQFLADNGVVGPERMYIEALLSWEDLDILFTLRVSLQAFVDDYLSEQEAGPSAGYVNQD